MEYYLAIKNEEILPFVTIWMELEGIMRSEISQTEKDKYFMISLICGVWTNTPPKQTNKQKLTQTKLIEKEIRLVVTRGGGLREGELDEGGQKVQTAVSR